MHRWVPRAFTARAWPGPTHPVAGTDGSTKMVTGESNSACMPTAGSVPEAVMTSSESGHPGIVAGLLTDTMRPEEPRSFRASPTSIPSTDGTMTSLRAWYGEAAPWLGSAPSSEGDEQPVRAIPVPARQRVSTHSVAVIQGSGCGRCCLNKDVPSVRLTLLRFSWSAPLARFTARVYLTRARFLLETPVSHAFHRVVTPAAAGRARYRRSRLCHQRHDGRNGREEPAAPGAADRGTRG